MNTLDSQFKAELNKMKPKDKIKVQLIYNNDPLALTSITLFCRCKQTSILSCTPETNTVTLKLTASQIKELSLKHYVIHISKCA